MKNHTQEKRSEEQRPQRQGGVAADKSDLRPSGSGGVRSSVQAGGWPHPGPRGAAPSEAWLEAEASGCGVPGGQKLGGGTHLGPEAQQF